MKPIVLKEVAKKYTEKHHPEWLHRVDRIWDMFEKIDFDSFISESGNHQLGNSFGIAGATDPEFQEYMKVISILAYINPRIKNDGIGRNEIRVQLNSVPEGIKLSEKQQHKLEDFISDILASSDTIPEINKNNVPVYNSDSEHSQFTKQYQVIIQPGLNNNKGLLIINDQQIGISSRECDLCKKLIDQLKKDWFRQDSERDRGWVSYDGFINYVHKWRTAKDVIGETVVINALNILNKKIEPIQKFSGPDNYLIQNGNNQSFNYPKHYRLRIHPDFLSVE